MRGRGRPRSRKRREARVQRRVDCKLSIASRARIVSLSGARPPQRQCTATVGPQAEQKRSPTHTRADIIYIYIYIYRERERVRERARRIATDGTGAAPRAPGALGVPWSPRSSRRHGRPQSTAGGRDRLSAARCHHGCLGRTSIGAQSRLPVIDRERLPVIDRDQCRLSVIDREKGRDRAHCKCRHPKGRERARV